MSLIDNANYVFESGGTGRYQAGAPEAELMVKLRAGSVGTGILIFCQSLVILRDRDNRHPVKALGQVQSPGHIGRI